MCALMNLVELGVRLQTAMLGKMHRNKLLKVQEKVKRK
jgi:hypothetical protein